MNPITINEDIHKAVDVAFPDYNRDHVPVIQRQFGKWPLLTYDMSQMPDQEVDELLGSCLQQVGQVIETPFEKFRYWIRNKFGIFYGMCERYPQGLRTVAVVSSSIYGNEKVVLKLFLNPATKPGVADWTSRLFWLSSRKEITLGAKHALLPPDQQKVLDMTCSWLFSSLEIMSREYLAPNNHVAQVKPDKPGKSVEWVQAREHYTLVHRKHAANNRDVVAGSVVKQDEGKHLTRVAHSRRAHSRILRSDRFRRDAFHGGIRTVLVKSTWCGPKEWKDTAGQIYQIVEMRKSHNKAA